MMRIYQGFPTMEFVKNVKYYVLEDLQALMEALNFTFSNSFEQVIY